MTKDQSIQLEKFKRGTAYLPSSTFHTIAQPCSPRKASVVLLHCHVRKTHGKENNKATLSPFPRSMVSKYACCLEVHARRCTLSTLPTFTYLPYLRWLCRCLASWIANVSSICLSPRRPSLTPPYQHIHHHTPALRSTEICPMLSTAVAYL